MANDWNERLRGYLAARNPRERATLAVGGVVLLLLLGYGLVYEPLSQARTKLAERLPRLRAELRLMRVQAAEIERLHTRAGDLARSSLEQRIKSSAAAYGLVGNITRFTPVTSEQVQLATQPLPNSGWIDWLTDLERQGISVERCRISAGGQPGLSSLELTLKGGQR